MSEKLLSANRPVRILLKVAYWLAVFAVSLAILIALILFLESRDQSQVGHRAGAALPERAASLRTLR